MQKLYYSISEVCQLIDEEQHILRYWEKEFEQLTPRKSRGGNRIYSLKDISIIKLIRQLLREEKLSLKGAKEKLNRILEETSEENNTHLDFKYSENALKFTDTALAENQIRKEDLIAIRNILSEILDLLKNI